MTQKMKIPDQLDFKIELDPVNMYNEQAQYQTGKIIHLAGVGSEYFDLGEGRVGCSEYYYGFITPVAPYKGPDVYFRVAQCRGFNPKEGDTVRFISTVSPASRYQGKYSMEFHMEA